MGALKSMSDTEHGYDMFFSSHFKTEANTYIPD